MLLETRCLRRRTLRELSMVHASYGTLHTHSVREIDLVVQLQGNETHCAQQHHDLCFTLRGRLALEQQQRGRWRELPWR